MLELTENKPMLRKVLVRITARWCPCSVRYSPGRWVRSSRSNVGWNRRRRERPDLDSIAVPDNGEEHGGSFSLESSKDAKEVSKAEREGNFFVRTKVEPKLRLPLKKRKEAE